MAPPLHSDDPTVNGKPVNLFVAGDRALSIATVSEVLSALPASVTAGGGLIAARTIEPAMMTLVWLTHGLGLGPQVTLRFDHNGSAIA